jgi:hypothetical protein
LLASDSDDKIALDVTVRLAATEAPAMAAVIEDVPGADVATVNATLDAPAGTTMTAGTVATDVLLLTSETLAPPAAAAEVRFTIPPTDEPDAMVDGVRTTLATVDTDVGAVDDELEQLVVMSATAITTTMVNADAMRRRVVIRTIPLRQHSSVTRTRSVSARRRTSCSIGNTFWSQKVPNIAA